MAAAELKTLGRYNLERVLGKGAMGVVYEGVDPRLNRRVAIKTILKSNLDEDTAKDFAMRFVREAQAVARLNHPNIVQVYDFGEEGEVAYLVMEFIKGKELKNFFDANERFDLKEAVRIMCELCEALEFAHQAGIVHRDIKPANVMIDSQARTKLTDFGVARVQDSDKTSVEKTQAGTMVGTPAYMSPEQITGGSVDKRTDVFSAGIILYQFLTGEKPFTGGGAWTIAKKIIQEDPPLPSTINNAVTPLFDSVVNKALAKNPEERYQSARDLAVGLKRALEGKPAEDDADKTVVGGAMPVMPKAQPRPAAAAVAPGATAGTTGSQAGSQEVELEFWRAIKDGNDPDDFDLYVQQFPTGIYAALAKRKISKMRGVAPEETGAKAREQEKKEAEEAARAEAVARQKLADEKAKLEAELARKEEEYKKREAEAETQRAASEKARLEAIEKAKQEAAAEREKAKQEAAAERERARQEAAAATEKAKQEAAAEVAKRETEYKKREAEQQEKSKQEAAARAKQEAEAKAKREAEDKARRDADEKSRKEAEARAKKDAEERAKREAEFKKREAELKAKAEEATLIASGKKKPSPVIPVIVAIVVAAIGIGAYSYFSPSGDEAAKAKIAAMQKQLEEANKQRAADLEKAKVAEEMSKQALAKAQKDAEQAAKSGDLSKQKELREALARAEAEARKQEASTKAAQAAQTASAKKAEEAKKADQERQAKLDAEKRKGESAKQAAAEQKAAAERVAAEKAAAAAASAAQERAAAAEKAAAERIAAAEKAAQEKIAAAEKAAAERARQIASAAPASGGAQSSGAQLFAQAAGLEKEGKGAEAVRTYTRAARSGNGKAARRLGEIYDKGISGVSRDYAESLKWYNTARALGEEVRDARR